MSVGNFDIQRFAEISNSTSDTVITGTADADSISNESTNVTINAFGGNDTIKNGHFKAFTYGSNNYAAYAVIDSGEGDDIVENYSNYVIINGGLGNDSIDNNFSNHSKLIGGDGSDTISNYGDNVIIDGGSGNDSIHANGDYVTITGGAGDDTVYIHNYTSVYQYFAGDGNDIITDFPSGAKLQIDDSYTNVTQGNDLIVKVGTGSITLKDCGYARIKVTDSAGNLSTINADLTLIAGTSGDDNIKNKYTKNVQIEGKEGNDSIDNRGSDVTIDGGSGNDTINNHIWDVSINGGAGNDIIYNSDYVASNTTVQINGGEGDDSIYNYQKNITILGGDGADYIFNSDEKVTIDGGAGNDTIQNRGTKVTINGGTGDDLISLSGSSQVYQYSVGDGNDSIEIDNPIQATFQINGDYTTEVSGDDLVVKIGNGSITFKGGRYKNFSVRDSAGNVATINDDNRILEGTSGDDTLENTSYSENIKIEGKEGNDSITNYSNQVTIDGGAGNDTITNSKSNYISIIGGSGEDYIQNAGFTTATYDYYEAYYGAHFSYPTTGNYVTMDGGDGNDTIENSDGNYAVIYGGAGDDYIQNVGVVAKEPILMYDTAIDLVELNDDYTTYTYTTYYGSNVMMIGDDGNDTIASEGGNNITMNGGAGDDILKGSFNSTDIFVYNAGNDTVQNYESGEIISFAAQYTGWVTDGNDLVINALEGSVRINDAKNKLVEVAGSDGNVVAHVYLASDYEGVINGSDFTTFEVISGSDNVANQIYAGVDGSSMRGGANSNDELYGNSGYDEFIYKYGDGQDIIFQAGNEDMLNLANISLEQISGAMFTDYGTYLKFNDGGSLVVNGQVGTFVVSGQSYSADYQNKTWS